MPEWMIRDELLKINNLRPEMELKILEKILTVENLRWIILIFGNRRTGGLIEYYDVWIFKCDSSCPSIGSRWLVTSVCIGNAFMIALSIIVACLWALENGISL